MTGALLAVVRGARDLLVGDDPKLALAVVLVLALGAVLAAADVLADGLPVLVAALLGIAVAGALLLEARS